MRLYAINLSDIPSSEADEKFFKKVFDNKLEWWRFLPLSFYLLTPDNIYTNTLTSWVVETYGTIFCTIMEIEIKDIGGLFPTTKEYIESGGKDPFQWFHTIRDPKFIPKWEREKEEKIKKNRLKGI